MQVSVSSLSKTFAGQRALIDVSARFEGSQVHALVGQNGSGKSTLIKVLAGVHQPDPGSAIQLVRGEEVVEDPRQIRERLHFIHQDLALVATMTGLENLTLGRGVRKGLLGRVRWGEERRRAQARFEELGEDVDLSVPVGRLPRGEQTMLAIVRALDGWEDPEQFLVLDEPTVALNRHEVDRLLAVVRRLVAKGAGIVLVSHQLDEVLEVADRVTVLRDGRVVMAEEVGRLAKEELVRAIAGHDVTGVRKAPRATTERQPALAVERLAGTRVRGIDFSVARGEILGITGLLGSGREEVASLLFGAQPGSGEIALPPETRLDLPIDPTVAVASGIGFLPEDRLAKAAIPEFTAGENLTLAGLSSMTGTTRLSHATETAKAQSWMDRLEVNPPLPGRPFGTFSGGNQQKIVLAKWLRIGPSVLLLDEPTQGIDVGAKAAIHALLLAQADAGAAIVMSSSDADELATVCHRVLVLAGGVLQTEIADPDLSPGRVLQAIVSGDTQPSKNTVLDPSSV